MAATQPPFAGRPPVDRPSSPDLLVETVTQQPITGPLSLEPPSRPPWALVSLLVVLGLAGLLGVFLMPNEPDPAQPVAYGLRLERPDGTVLAGAAMPGDTVVPVVVGPAPEGDAPFVYLLRRDYQGVVHRLHPATGDARLPRPDGKGRVSLPPLTVPDSKGELLVLVISPDRLAEPQMALSRLAHGRTRALVVRRPLRVQAPPAQLAGDAAPPPP
ncbi:MAG: hypothetical protein KC613_09125 [Myxococcales bacterium]|nr:hypothetical protein [Myxococcales bacterium]